MWSWDWTQPFSWPGLIWGLLTSVVLPAAAIIFAVRIGQRQAQTTLDAQLAVLKAEAERDEQRAILQREARLDRGYEEAIAAISGLQRAVFQTTEESVDVRVQSAARLPMIAAYLGSDLEDITKWIGREFSIIGAGLNGERDERGLPVFGDKMIHRCGHFISVLADWRTGEYGVEWFKDRKHARLENTKMMPTAPSESIYES
jgi:hypothetical protein